VMVHVGDGFAIFEKLLREGVIVRPLKEYNLPEWVRISVGTMEENKKLIAALKKVLQTKARQR
jgi:histidinol-phosphate aminotransferase